MATTMSASFSLIRSPSGAFVKPRISSKGRGGHFKGRNLQVRAFNQEQAAEESSQVLERTQFVHTMDELSAAFHLAGDALVMVSIESDEECTMSDENAWAPPDAPHLDNLKTCRDLSASLARMARDAVQVRFVKIDVVGDDDARNLADQLGVHVFPTHQYYKKGQLLWQHVGAGAGAEAAISEGLLYYGGAGAPGLDVSKLITEVSSKSDLDDFLSLCSPVQDAAEGFNTGFDVPCEKQLGIVDVSLSKDPPAGCLHIYPAAVSLAKNTVGFTRWARLNVDASNDASSLAKELGVTEVPTFVFFADGEIVDKYTGSDRLELMNHVLEFQNKNGIVMPQRAAPKRMTHAEARELQRAARERAKERGLNPNW